MAELSYTDSNYLRTETIGREGELYDLAVDLYYGGASAKEAHNLARSILGLETRLAEGYVQLVLVVDST